MGKKTVLPAVRGQFTDASGHALAQNVDRYTVENPPADASNRAYVLDMVVESANEKK